MATFNEHPRTQQPRYDQPDRETLRQVADDTDRLREGEVNWLGEFTIAAATTSTTVTDDRVRDNSQISFTPMDLAAAGLATTLRLVTLNEGRKQEHGDGSAGQAVGNFVLNHAAPNVNALFRYSIKW